MKWNCCKNLRVGVILVCLTSGAFADVLYSTFGPGDTYDTTTMWQDGRAFIAEYDAFTFELGAGEYTDISVTLPVGHSAGLPSNHPFQVKIYANDGIPSYTIPEGEFPDEHTPGTLLGAVDALAGDIPQVSFEDAVPLTTFEFSDLTLSGGSRYWVALEPSVEIAGYIGWYANSQGIMDFQAQRLWSPPYQPMPDQWSLVGTFLSSDGAMRVAGTLVPEPSALALLLIGGFACSRRRI